MDLYVGRGQRFQAGYHSILFFQVSAREDARGRGRSNDPSIRAGASSLAPGGWSAGAAILTLFLVSTAVIWGKFAYFYRYANEDQPILFPLSFIAGYRCGA